MSYKTILVHIDPGQHNERRLEAAIRLARRYDACLVGLYAFSPYSPPGYVMAQMGPKVRELQEKAAAELMARTEGAFRKQTSTAGFDNIEWHAVYDDPVHAMSSRAKYADLVVISQSDATDDSEADADFPERLVLSVGRPVLILPNCGSFPSIGKRILVAWNASQEATRAVSNAIPLLKTADSIYVMAVHSRTNKSDNLSSENLVRYLGRLGVHAEAKDDYGVDIDVGNELLSRSSDLSADLIVMGCYGHSRLREWALGGATRTMLESMTVPVLMSH